MEGATFIGSFQGSIPEDMLEWIRTPGIVNKKELWVKGLDENAGLNSCIVFDKLADSVVNFMFSVYCPGKNSASTEDVSKTAGQHLTDQPQKSEKPGGNYTKGDEPIQLPTPSEKVEILFTDCSSQTESVSHQDTTMQTDSKDYVNYGAQTIAKTFQDGEFQTDPPATITNIDVQTDNPVLVETDMQTDIKEYLNIKMQTDIKQYVDVDMQTNIKEYMDVDMQTNIKEYVDVDMQTHIKEYMDTDMQTNIKEYMNTITQTEGGRSTEFVCSQTDISMAWKQEQECQAYVETCNSDCQTELCVSEKNIQTERFESHATSQTEIESSQNESQTDLSYFKQTESSSQVEIFVAEAENQTDNENAEQTSQTERSMAWENEAECQAVVEMHQNDSQTTEVGSLNQLSQTDITSGVHKDSQTLVDLDDQGSQATVGQDSQASQVSVDQGTQGSQATVTMGQQSSQASVVLDSKDSQTGETNTNDLEDEPFVSSQVSSQDDIENANVDSVSESAIPQKRKQLEEIKTNTCDGFAQTDPVTIIIGDASFLVKKLKSATSPSKISSSGNEIEIELKDDGDSDYHQRTQGTKLEPGEILYKQQGEKENVNVKQEIPRYFGRGRGGVRQRGGVSQRGGRNIPLATPPQSTHTVSTPSPRTTPSSPGSAQRPSPAMRGGRTNIRGRINPTKKTPPPAPKIIQPIDPDLELSGYDPQGRYSCPFCTLAFIDSPALYEHLQMTHGPECGKLKKPRGREGKTIIPRQREYSPEPAMEGPPVLIPQQPFGIQGLDYDSEREPGEVLYREVESEPGEVLYKVIDKEDGEIDYRAQEEQTVIEPVEQPQEELEDVSVEPIVHGKGRSQIEAEIAEKTAQLSSEDVEGEDEEVVDEDVGDENYSCPVCPKRFKRSAELYAHVQNAHDMDKEEALQMHSAEGNDVVGKQGEEYQEEKEAAEEGEGEEDQAVDDSEQQAVDDYEQQAPSAKRKRSSSGGTPTKRHRQSVEDDTSPNRLTRRSLTQKSPEGVIEKKMPGKRGRPRKH